MRLIWLIGIIFLVSGCSNRIYIPESFSSADSKAVIGAIETDDLSLFMENINNTGSHFIYDLEVVNNGDDPILVDPHQIFYYGSHESFPALQPGQDVHSSFASATEQARGVFALKEKQVNNDIRANVRAKQAVGVVLMIAAAAVVVNDVVQDSKDFNKEIWTRSDARRSQARDLATFAGLVTLDMVRAGMEMEQQRQYEDLEFLPQEYLHKRMILPGESIRGKVFLPKRDVDHIRLIVPLESRNYVFDFRKATGAEMRLIK